MRYFVTYYVTVKVYDQHTGKYLGGWYYPDLTNTGLYSIPDNWGVSMPTGFRFCRVGTEFFESQPRFSSGNPNVYSANLTGQFGKTLQLTRHGQTVYPVDLCASADNTTLSAVTYGADPHNMYYHWGRYRVDGSVINDDITYFPGYTALSWSLCERSDGLGLTKIASYAQFSDDFAVQKARYLINPHSLISSYSDDNDYQVVVGDDGNFYGSFDYGVFTVSPTGTYSTVLDISSETFTVKGFPGTFSHSDLQTHVGGLHVHSQNDIYLCRATYCHNSPFGGGCVTRYLNGKPVCTYQDPTAQAPLPPMDHSWDIPVRCISYDSGTKQYPQQRLYVLTIAFAIPTPLPPPIIPPTPGNGKQLKTLVDRMGFYHVVFTNANGMVCHQDGIPGQALNPVQILTPGDYPDIAEQPDGILVIVFSDTQDVTHALHSPDGGKTWS